MTSIKEIAHAAGVSVTTVSFVLNNKGNIPQETRDRVWQVVKETGYTRSIHARNLRDNTSRIIGYAQHARRGQYQPLLDTFLYELVRLIEAQDRHILLFHNDQEDPIEVYKNLIDSKRVDGFILSYTERDDPRFGFLHEEANFPFAAFGQSLSPLDEETHWVDVDGEAGLYAATEHLIQNGHRRIGIIAWPVGSASGDLRFMGYKRVLADYGIPSDDNLVIRMEDSVANGYAAAQRFMALDAPPTAVVAITDSFAFGAMRCFNEHGRQIAITGFDDTPMAELMGLTSIHQPVDRVAQILVDMLLAQIDDEPVEVKRHLLKPELIIRASSTVPFHTR